MGKKSHSSETMKANKMSQQTFAEVAEWIFSRQLPDSADFSFSQSCKPCTILNSFFLKEPLQAFNGNFGSLYLERYSKKYIALTILQQKLKFKPKLRCGTFYHTTVNQLVKQTNINPKTVGFI